MLNSREKFIWCRGGSLPLHWSTSLLSFLAGHLKLSEKKITCLNLEKCSLLLTPPAEIARETYGSVMHHLLSPFAIVQKFRKNDSFANELSSLGKPNNIGFSFKRIHTYNSVQFRCARAAYNRVGKDRARPTQMLIALE